MRFRPDLRVMACLVLGLWAPPLLAANETFTPAEVERAMKNIKADPDLATERSMRTIKWEGATPNLPKKPHNFGWLSWIKDLFTWIGQASRLLFWLVLFALGALLVVFIYRLIAARGSTLRVAKFVAPTHVQDLDIRPESLPDDIGAAARALWDAGEKRAALALLYRGLLSRLAHVHEVPIKNSSTEGDCLDLATRKLDPVRTEFVRQLVRIWQHATYGGITVDTATVHNLCAGFAASLDAPPPAAVARDGFAGQTA